MASQPLGAAELCAAAGEGRPAECGPELCYSTNSGGASRSRKACGCGASGPGFKWKTRGTQADRIVAASNRSVRQRGATVSIKSADVADARYRADQRRVKLGPPQPGLRPPAPKIAESTARTASRAAPLLLLLLSRECRATRRLSGKSNTTTVPPATHPNWPTRYEASKWRFSPRPSSLLIKVE